MSLTIYAFPFSPRSFKVLWAAHQADVPYEFKFVDFTKNAQSDPAYLKINPNGRAPALQDGDYVLWESNAIVEYLASLKPASGLLPTDTKARLQVTKWLYFESAHWDQACAIFAFERVVKKLFNRGAIDEKEIARGTQQFERIGKVLDSALGAHRYVAGEQLTVADIALGASLCIADDAQFPIEQHRHIQRWKADIQSLPSWKKASELRVPRAT